MNYDFAVCRLCPRACGADRVKGRGVCGAGLELNIARAALHYGEEPCISGKGGSGVVFFSDCGLRCVFCQNYELSHSHLGKGVSICRLAEIFLELQQQGAHNINLVTACSYVPQIAEALDKVKGQLHIPVAYNSSGYESLATLLMLKGYIDIYMPDFKYADGGLAKRYSSAEDYPCVALAAIKEMQAQTGVPQFDEQGMLRRGTLIRHLVLPSCYHDSLAVLELLHKELPADSFIMSLMCQYTPDFLHGDYPELKRRLTVYEYRKVLDKAEELGFFLGYQQSSSSARAEYTPHFGFEGV